jgi:AcrR family transcriptional regulator
MASTSDRILDAAERLFAQNGFAGTSLRDITAAAGANVAAVNYHFGSKEEMLRAVLTRIVEPANRARLELLERAEADAAPGPPDVEAILRAFIGPDLRAIRDLGERGVVINRLIGRSYTEPTDLVRRMIQEQFGELGFRFHQVLCRALPHVPADEVAWRLSAVVAVITAMLADAGTDGTMSMLDRDDLDKTLRRMIAFLAPGMRAPASTRRRRRSGSGR